MTGFIVTAIVMLIGVIPCGIVMCRGTIVEAVVAYEAVSAPPCQLVPGNAVTCRSIRRTGERVPRGAARYRAVPATSEQTWSNHGSRTSPSAVTGSAGCACPTETRVTPGAARSRAPAPRPSRSPAYSARRPAGSRMNPTLGNQEAVRSLRCAAVGPDWRANVEPTWAGNSLHEGPGIGIIPGRNRWVRRQGLEPRTRRLRVRCPVRFFSQNCCRAMTAHAATCRSVRLPVSAAACRYRVLPGRTATSEQT